MSLLLADGMLAYTCMRSLFKVASGFLESVGKKEEEEEV